MSTTCNEGCEAGPKVYLAEVESVYANQSPDCPVQSKYDTPFFDETLPNKFITTPLKGNNFVIYVANTARWAVGQWLYIEMIGKYPIVNILNGTTLVLENVNDTPVAGTTFNGVRKIWITEPELVSETAQSIEDLTANLQSDNFEFCASVDQSNEAETANPIGAVDISALCTPCSKSGVAPTKVVRCLKYFKNIVFKWFTIGLPSIPRTALGEVSFSKNGATVIESLQPVLWHPQAGDLYKRDLPTTMAIDSYDGTKHTYINVPSDFAYKFYAVSANATTGKPEWRHLDFSVPVNIGQALATGSVNMKTAIETGAGITLPDTGEVVAIVMKAAADTIYLVIDLASPTKTIAASSTLQAAYIPVSMLLN